MHVVHKLSGMEMRIVSRVSCYTASVIFVLLRIVMQFCFVDCVPGLCSIVPLFCLRPVLLTISYRSICYSWKTSGQVPSIAWNLLCSSNLISEGEHMLSSMHPSYICSTCNFFTVPLQTTLSILILVSANFSKVGQHVLWKEFQILYGTTAVGGTITVYFPISYVHSAG